MEKLAAEAAPKDYATKPACAGCQRRIYRAARVEQVARNVAHQTLS